MTSRRIWQIVAIAIAIAMAMLIVRAYQKPDFVIEMLAAVGLC